MTARGGDNRPGNGGKGDKPTRDARGRWVKGHCPNPNGRPKKERNRYEDPADLRIFMNTMVDVVVNGEIQKIDRRAALLHKMFEKAMKGSVYMQRFLFEQFEKNDEQLAKARVRYEELLAEWFFRPRDAGQPPPRMPFEVELQITGLQVFLHHYFPKDYPPAGLAGWPEDSDEDK